MREFVERRRFKMKWLNVGKIVNTHGVRGEVRVLSSTDFPEKRYAKGSELGLFMPKSKEPMMLTIASHRQHKNFDLLTFEDHTNINEVEQYRNGTLKVSKEHLEELGEHEYYHYEIIDCTVVDMDEVVIGMVTEIIITGANDVWEVQAENGKKHYIPYIEDVVKEVDIANKKIKIDPLEGLLS